MKVAGTILVIIALVVGIVPQFTSCQSQGRSIQLANGKTIPMKCMWTAQAELPIAASMLVLGGMTFRNRRKEILRSLSLFGGIFGVFVALLPTVLIGVCAGNEMLCSTIMKPTLILSGILTAVVSAVVFVQATRVSPAEKAVYGLEHAS